MGVGDKLPAGAVSCVDFGQRVSREGEGINNPLMSITDYIPMTSHRPRPRCVAIGGWARPDESTTTGGRGGGSFNIMAAEDGAARF